MEIPYVVNETCKWLPLLAGFQVTVHKPINPGAVTAERWLKQAEEAYGPESPKIVPFLYELEERILNGPGNPIYRSVLALVERALNIRQKHAGEESLELAEAMAKLGECAAFLRNTTQAEEYLDKALVIRRTQLGEEHPLTGQVWTFLAMARIIASQPTAQPEMLVMILNSQPLPVHRLPLAAQEAAARALPIYDQLQRSKWGDTGQQPTNAFNYYALRLAFRVYEQMNEDFTGLLKALPKSSAVPGGGGCFVATAVYGDADHPQVAALRRFRDERLLQHTTGRTAVRLYYLAGPVLARFLADHPRIIRLCRMVLDRLAQVVWK